MVYWKHLFNRFHFKDNEILNDEVKTISAIERQSFVDNWNADLPSKVQIAKVEFVTEALFVSRFQQTGTQFTMNINRRANDLFCQVLFN